jgi:hypothetical protein
MTKRKYKLRGVGTEYLQETEIEADSAEAAEEEYRQMWQNGELYAEDYELDIKTEEK